MRQDGGVASFDLLLVTCVYEKADGPRKARDLYVSPYFRQLREYAEQSGKPWFIVSAEHGLVHPDEWLTPYERYLPDTPGWYQRAWGAWVVARLRMLAGELDGRTIEIHAAQDYVVRIHPHLHAAGATITLGPPAPE